MSDFRADRFASLYFVRPLRHLMFNRNQMRIPILMYHSISEVSHTDTHPYFAAETSPKVFAEQMRFLHDNDYCTISPAEVVTLLSSGQTDKKKFVVITFDDGYRDFYTEAFPILNQLGMSATVYLPTAYIKQRSSPFKGKECLTWAEVRELHKAGVGFGSHTVTHPKLTGLCHAELERELRRSKEKIENELGCAVQSFAYPYAFPEQDREFAHRLRDLLMVTGYNNGVSTILGTVQSLEERYFLKRVPANSWDDLAFFEAKIQGNYDWLHNVQYLKKLILQRFAGTPIRNLAADPAKSFNTGH
jgi:peptidoglycan/xylan/chitin deacetylase (PgdA/CDA1 family)